MDSILDIRLIHERDADGDARHADMLFRERRTRQRRAKRRQRRLDAKAEQENRHD